jgi:hypothetical protein
VLAAVAPVAQFLAALELAVEAGVALVYLVKALMVFPAGHCAARPMAAAADQVVELVVLVLILVLVLVLDAMAAGEQITTKALLMVHLLE